MFVLYLDQLTFKTMLTQHTLFRINYL